MARRKTRRIKSPSGDYHVPVGFMECGFPSALPKLPAKVETLAIPPLTGDWGQAAAWLRSKGTQLLFDHQPAIWAAGVGHRDGQPAVLLFVEPDELDRCRGALPEEVEDNGVRLPIVMRAFSRDVELTGNGTIVTKPPHAGALTGSHISTRRDGIFTDDPNGIHRGGGTLAGTFPTRNGNSTRGITCTHVALAAGVERLIRSLPSSLRTLLESPRGKHILAWDDPLYRFGGPAPAQNLLSSYGPGPAYELFEVDTEYPILMPIPFVPGMSPALAALMPVFMYVDVCSGRVRPRLLTGTTGGTPEIPEVRRTVRGAKLGSSIFPLPGNGVYKIGNTTGTQWGEVLAVNMMMILPIPPLVPLLPAQILIFNLNVYSLRQQPGDSGAATVRERGHRPTSVDGLGSGFTSWGPPNYMVRLVTRTRF